jgi:hypothetical protein
MLFGAAVIAVFLSLITLVWTALPAIPLAHLPAMSLTLSDLDKLTAIAALPSLTTAFYQWLAWTMALVVMGTAAVALARPSRATRAAGLLASILGLLITISALKAPVSWHDYWADTSQVRAGTILFELFFVACAIACRLNPVPARIAEPTGGRPLPHIRHRHAPSV